MMSEKLILAIIRDEDSADVLEALIAHDFHVTRVSSTGGFLRRGSDTLLIGAAENRVDDALNVIRVACPGEPPPDEHRATIFVLDATSFTQI